jgi:vacuolar-type H+-ATPase subunit I/STV1
MCARTIFLAKLIGLFLLIVGLSVLTQSPWMADTLKGIMHDRPLSYVLGMIVLASGLAIVLVHNRWSGGLLAVVVTILGWITLIKGAFLLLLPPDMLTNLYGTLQIGNVVYVYGAIDIVIGAYLTIGGFMTPARREGDSPAARPTVGVPSHG